MSTTDFTDLGTNPSTNPSTNSENVPCESTDNDKLNELIKTLEKMGGFAIPIELKNLPPRFHLTAKQAREKAIDILYNTIMSKIGLEVVCLKTIAHVPHQIADAIAVKLREKEYIVEIENSPTPGKKQLNITW